jgi:hypothetical protein
MQQAKKIIGVSCHPKPAPPPDQSTNQPINQSTNQPINQSTNQPINQSTNQPINQSTNQPINHSLAHPLPIEPLKLILLSTHNHNLHTKDRLIDIRLELRRAVHVMRVAVFPKQQEPDSSAVAGPGSVRRVGW